MRRSIVLLALLLPSLARAEPAEAPWEPLDFEAEDGSRFALQRGSIVREGEQVTLRTSLQLREPSPSGLYRSTGRWRYDCAARTVELLDYVVYGQSGDTLEAFVVPEPEVEPVQPGTAHDFFLRAIC